MKKIIISLFSIILILALSYSGAWFFVHQKIERAIDQFHLADGPAMGIEFYGHRPEISGFPGQPVVTYKEGYNIQGLRLAFPEIRFTGFPLPHFPFTIEITDEGFIWQEGREHPEFFNDFKLVTTVPKSFPKSSLEYHIRQWQKNVGSIDIQEIKLTAKEMQIVGKGTLGLDNALQPTVFLDTEIKGYNTIVIFLTSVGMLKPLPAALALSVLNAMAQTDPETKEQSVKLDITIKDRDLSLGPINAVKIPTLRWGQASSG